MAVQAAPSHGVVDATLAARGRTEQRRGLTLAGYLSNLASMRRMALVAQERRSRLQHAFHGGAVRVVAVRAVFSDRFVGMDERSALFHVTGEASLHHAIAFHEFRSNRAMRIMAVGTRHLALGNRVMRWPVDLRTLLFMAIKADLGLGTFIHHFIAQGVNFMA